MIKEFILEPNWNDFGNTDSGLPKFHVPTRKGFREVLYCTEQRIKASLKCFGGSIGEVVTVRWGSFPVGLR